MSRLKFIREVILLVFIVLFSQCSTSSPITYKLIEKYPYDITPDLSLHMKNDKCLVINDQIDSIYSQTKKMLGDTVAYNSYQYVDRNKTLKNVENEDFRSSTRDFNFRFRNYGQAVEIWKDNDSIGGILTNYIFKTKYDKLQDQNIFIKKIELDKELASKTYNLIFNSGILDLDTDRKIDGWEQGMDGITYTIEHANKKEYWYKSYWTPSSRDSLKEALIVINFINKLDDILALEANREKFIKKLPHRGCYNNGGMSVMCYIANSYEFGYSGSIKYPLGYIATLNLGFIGNLKTDLGVQINHQLSLHREYDFSALLVKNNLFLRNRDNKITDFFWYNYRQTKHNDIYNRTLNRDNKLLYGLRHKSTSLALGVDFLNSKYSKTGGAVLINQYISLPKMTLSASTSMFDDLINYKIETSKTFNINLKPIKYTSISVFYEIYLKQDNVGVSLSITI